MILDERSALIDERGTGLFLRARLVLAVIVGRLGGVGLGLLFRNLRLDDGANATRAIASDLADIFALLARLRLRRVGGRSRVRSGGKQQGHEDGH